MQHKQWRDMTKQERTTWGGIEPSPMTLVAVRSKQTSSTMEYDEQLDDKSLYPTRSASSTRRYQIEGISSKGLHSDVQNGGEQKLHDMNKFFHHKRTQQNFLRYQQVQPSQTLLPRHNDKEGQETRGLVLPQQSTPHSCSSWPWLLGAGMIMMLLLWIGGSFFVNRWQRYQEDLQYGYPRIYQVDAKVGHNDRNISSHYIVLKLNHQVNVIEFPGGDSTKAKVYLGPILLGADSDRDIVTLRFKDVNGDGKPDMILRVANANYIYINDNNAFRPLHVDEHSNL